MLEDAFLAMNVYLPWGRMTIAKEKPATWSNKIEESGEAHTTRYTDTQKS